MQPTYAYRLDLRPLHVGHMPAYPAATPLTCCVAVPAAAVPAPAVW